MENDNKYIPPQARQGGASVDIKYNPFAMKPEERTKRDDGKNQRRQDDKKPFGGFKKSDGDRQRLDDKPSYRGPNKPRDDRISSEPINIEIVPSRDFSALLNRAPANPYQGKSTVQTHRISEKELFDPDKQQKANYEAFESVVVEVEPKVEGFEPITAFSQLNVDPRIVESLAQCNYTQPTPVQQYAIPLILQQKDLVVTANTGSGKTAAFAIPIIQSLVSQKAFTGFTSKAKPRALVIVPTRELAQQSAENFMKVAVKIAEKQMRIMAVYGGESKGPQINQLKRNGIDVLIGCPGRLKDLYECQAISFSNVQYLVLDEADRCLDMGFEPDIRYIVDKLDMTKKRGVEGGTRQNLLFSATFPRPIYQLAQDFLTDHVMIKVGAIQANCQVQQKLLEIHYQDRFAKIMELLEEFKDQKVLIFLDTKIKCNELALEIRRQRIGCEMLHGDMVQEDRTQALKSFIKESTVLVATDVAQRGLDIPQVKLVINYDPPKSMEDYIHRIGRTGRVGQEGVAITFVDRKTRTDLLKDLVREIEAKGGEVDQQVKALYQPNFHAGGGYRDKRPRTEPSHDYRREDSRSRGWQRDSGKEGYQQRNGHQQQASSQFKPKMADSASGSVAPVQAPVQAAPAKNAVPELDWD